MKEVKTLFNANAHQKMTSVETSNNQVDGMTHSVDSKPPLPPNEPKNKVAKVAEIQVMHGLDHMVFHSLLTWLQLLLTTGTTPGTISQQPRGRMTISENFLHAKETVLSLLEQTLSCF